MQAKIKRQFLIGVTDTPEAMDKIVKDETENLTNVSRRRESSSRRIRQCWSRVHGVYAALRLCESERGAMEDRAQAADANLSTSCAACDGIHAFLLMPTMQSK
jgi:hypothetical protein